MNSPSALSNCGGFPETFANSELTPLGLLDSYRRAIEVQTRLRQRYPSERHANCHLGDFPVSRTFLTDSHATFMPQLMYN